jgi:hypothetical protein
MRTSCDRAADLPPFPGFENANAFGLEPGGPSIKSAWCFRFQKENVMQEPSLYNKLQALHIPV